MRNSIPCLLNSNGTELFSEGAKGNVAVDYFMNIFPSTSPQNFDELLRGMVHKVTDEMNANLIGPINDEETKGGVLY